MPGQFQTFKYETSETESRILPIRLQPETIFGENEEPEGGLTGSQKVRSAGGGRSGYGIHCRYMTLSRKVGTGDGPYTGGTVSANIPLLAEGAVALFPVGSTVSYGGQEDWEVASHTGEKIR
jgi:hypothetical protein